MFPCMTAFGTNPNLATTRSIEGDGYPPNRVSGQKGYEKSRRNVAKKTTILTIKSIRVTCGVAKDLVSSRMGSNKCHRKIRYPVGSVLC